MYFHFKKQNTSKNRYAWFLMILKGSDLSCGVKTRINWYRESITHFSLNDAFYQQRLE